MSDQVEMRLDWLPPGPVAARFMTSASAAPVKIINGPIGSGKTTTVVQKALKLAAAQRPSGRHRLLNHRRELVPVRQVRLAVVRETYRQLWRATMPSWFKRIPMEVGNFTGSDGTPAEHRIQLEVGDGSTIVDFTAQFAAIGENDVESFCRGFEPTFWWINEMDLQPEELLGYALDRAGRFPDMSDGGPSWRGVLADCYAPTFENWMFTSSVKDEVTGRNLPGIFTMSPAQRLANGIELYIQPGGRTAQAENLVNLPPGYYAPKVGQSREYVVRMIDNKPGVSRAGKPVHPDFNHALHVVEGLQPLAGIGLVIGIDPRTIPSAIFLQRIATGQRRITRELQGEVNMGARRFGRALAQFIKDHFGFLPSGSIRGICDPSARYGADREDGEQDWIQLVEEESGIRIDAAPTNNLDLRREALRVPLQQLIEGEPAMLVSDECPILIAGLNTGFRFRKLNRPGLEAFSGEVEKNHFADICVAAEYACLADGTELDVRARTQGGPTQRQAIDGDHDGGDYQRPVGGAGGYWRGLAAERQAQEGGGYGRQRDAVDEE